MVNLKTKSDKHNLDNEKRRQSIKTREKVRLSQSQIIKQALSNTSLSNSCSKKIVFDDERNGNERNLEHKKSNGEKPENCILFGDSDSEEDSPTIKEKIQFSGKKGFELLNLQSTYGNDERFKIDERFLEDEKEGSDINDDGSAENKDETDPSKEKKKMLNILESVLGEPVTAPKSTKYKKRQFDMIRYDASKKEHEIYEIKPDPETLSSSKKKKLKRLIEKDIELPKPHVSKEKFYEVSGEIKNTFNEKERGQFSLLQTYGADDVQYDQEVEEQEDMEEEEVVTEEKAERKPEVRESQPMEKLKEEKKAVLAQGIWKESFFFQSDDPRFKESFEFINKKNSAEAAEAAENYDQTRRKLKEILRLHMKKQLQKKDPFKNKIGGSNKKQLSNSRSSNRVIASNRRPKMTPRRKV